MSLAGWANPLQSAERPAATPGTALAGCAPDSDTPERSELGKKSLENATRKEVFIYFDE